LSSSPTRVIAGGAGATQVAPAERVPSNLIEVILAQGSTFRGSPAVFLEPERRLRTIRRPAICMEKHMAHPSSVPLARSLRAAFLSCALLASATSFAQPAPTSAPPAGSAPARHVIAEIQVIPRPAGTAADRYKHVDAAIAVIQASGLKYEVHGLGTVIEGPREKIWPLLQAVHQATLEAGAERTLSVIKVSSGAEAGGPRVEDLVRKFR
jgi:uncharacterized protein YqgV (UPF0045/DUF77 family)